MIKYATEPILTGIHVELFGRLYSNLIRHHTACINTIFQMEPLPPTAHQVATVIAMPEIMRYVPLMVALSVFVMMEIATLLDLYRQLCAF